MLKIFRSNSKKRLDGEENGQDGDRGERRGRKPGFGNIEAAQAPESSPVAAVASSATVPNGENSVVIDDSAFFSKISTESVQQDWDEWSAPKEGSSDNRMRFKRPSKSKSMAIISTPTSPRNRRVRASKSGELFSLSDHTGGSHTGVSPETPRKARKKKSEVSISSKLRKLEETGFSGGGADVSDGQSLMAMTTGGMFVGKDSDPTSRLDALMLNRSNSDSNLNGKKKKKKKTKSKSSGALLIKESPKRESKQDTALEKKMRKPRRRTDTDLVSKTSHARSHRSRSGSRSGSRRKPSISAALSRSQSLSSIDIASSDLRTTGEERKRRKKKGRVQDDHDVREADSPSVSTKETYGSKSSKRSKKKKKSKGDNTADDSSCASDASSVASRDKGGVTNSPYSLDSKGRKKRKSKKAVKRSKSTTDVLSASRYDSDGSGGDGVNVIASLESLADEIRSAGSRKSGSAACIEEEPLGRRKERRYSASGLSSSSNEGMPRRARRHSSNDLSSMALAPPSYNTVESVAREDTFEKAWVADQPVEKTFEESSQSSEIQNKVDVALVANHPSAASVECDDQEKIISLQNQLAEALEKMVAKSREQIEDKNQFLKASSDLSRTKAQLQEAMDERHELLQEIKRREETIEEERQRIEKLEQAIERQLDTQDALEVKLERSEDEVEKLLMEMQQLEERLESGDGGQGGGGASLTELRLTKKALEEKEAEVITKKKQIEQLEQELKDALTVPQLQIEELDAEKKSLQGKLKSERLEYNQKLEAKDDIIAQLQRQLDSYSASSDAPDLISAKEKLADARADATAVREDLVAAQKMIDALQSEREDLVTRNNSLVDTIRVLEKDVKELTEKTEVLNEKVKQWTEKTYEWKSKAESAERKLDAWSEESYDGSSVGSAEVVEDAPQGLLLQAAMGKGRKNKWNPFTKKGEEQNETADDIRIRTLEERNQTLEDELAELRSEIVRMQTAHKEELYSAKKKVAQLEGENEALVLQNATLEQLSRANQTS